MLIYNRYLNLPALLQNKSFFLLGPRATGKSFLVREQLNGKALILNLLHTNLYLQLSQTPWKLREILDEGLAQHAYEYIVIDEIQKIPELLNEVHDLIETKNLRFLLTGSSARKLKYGHANLLAGRAWTAHLYPLSWSEIPNFNLDRYLQFGGLPSVYSSKHPQEELHAYVNTYLYEEIQAEGLVRKIPQFARFLTVAGLANGQTLNFSQIASDTGIPASTIREHYTILTDTLLGFHLPPWGKSLKRKPIATAKFYLFDTGVCHTLTQTKTLDRNSDLYGRSFEHWIAIELQSYLSYHRLRDQLAFWKTTQQHEVDFIIGDHTAIEVKATSKVTKHDLKGLLALQEENRMKQFFLISQDPIETKISDIRCLHWQTFMELLWSGQIIEKFL